MSSSNFQNIEYKASSGQINLDEAQGIVECFVAGIGNKDSVGDICVSGAFTKSLQRRKPRVVWGHNWNDPIGKVLEIYEVPVSDPRLPMKMKMAGIGGLYARVQFNLQSEKGREAFANVAFFGEEQEWSIGYKTLRSQFDEKLQANILYEVELYEVSPVLHGANQLTGTISVKSDEEKMHGMMPMMPTAPAKPSADDVFDEGLAKPVSGPALAALMVELSRRAGGTIEIIEANENSVVFKKPGKGKFRISYHFNGSEYMFGKPELIASETPARMESGPSPIVGVTAKPGARTGITVSKPPRNLPATPMPVAVKPSEEGEGMVVVPLPKVQYDGAKKKPTMAPVVVAEEQELADALSAIAEKYGKFNEDGTGVWAGYAPASENENADIGVKCSNCILYQGDGKCKIIAREVEPNGSCRFAVIPDNVVQVGDKKKRYMDAIDDSELDMVAELEEKYPGEFILGVVRGLAKRKKKRKRFGGFKSLDQFGIEEAELEAKGLDPFLAQESSYLIPVSPENAFEVKSFIDPVLDYHRIDTTVTEHGIVINSPLDQDSKDALEAAFVSASKTLKKKFDNEEIEEKALGRRARRTIGKIGRGRRSIGGRGGKRGMGIPSGDLDPRTRRDTDLDGTLFDNIPGWEQPDPTPDGPGSINNPKPSRRQMAQSKRPARKRTIQKEREKLSSGDIRRHSAMSEADEKNFPDKQEDAKRATQEQIAEMWREQGLGWTNVPRYPTDKKFSNDYLRGREIGVNQDRIMWSGDSVKKRPDNFNEKAKAGVEYNKWFRSYASSVSSYLDANRKPDDDNWRGIEAALRGGVKEKLPDTRNWNQDDRDSLDIFMRSLGFEEENLSSGRREAPAPRRRTARPAADRRESEPTPKRTESDVEKVRQEINRERMEQADPEVPYDSADVDNMVNHWIDNEDVHEERLAEADGDLRRAMENEWEAELDRQLGQSEEPADSAPRRTERLASGDRDGTGISPAADSLELGTTLGDMRAFRRIESGESAADIAKELGVEEIEVKKAAARGRMFRAVFRGRGEQPELGSGSTFREIFRRTQKGESTEAIAREFDVPESEIKKAAANGRFLEAIRPTQEDRLSSGAEDREMFKRVRDGESTLDIANEMGVPEVEVKKSVARGRFLESINRTDEGGLSSGASDEVEFDAQGYPTDYKDYLESIEMEEAADLDIYERRMAGQSVSEIAESLGLSKERVRQGEMAHARKLISLDREYEDWQKRWGDFHNPLEGIAEGERLSSGKLDEVYSTVQQSLIKMLETADPKDWSFPWHKTGMLPNNPTNKKRPYSGTNMMFLMFAQQQNGYSTSMWAGFKQWSAMGGKVKKGEKGTPVLIPKTFFGEDEDGERKAKGVYFSVAYVFNADQVEGESVEALKKEVLDAPKLSEEERVSELESALSEVGAIVNTGGDQAFYRPSTDEITLPPFETFKSGVQYYSTYAHEMMHWTGHPDRLNRPNLNKFGSPEYAKEELVAEIASAFFLAAVGLAPEPREDHAQYLNSWLRALKADPDALKNAFAEAQKAADFAIGKSPSLSKKLGKKVAESDVSDVTGGASYPEAIPDPAVAEKLSSGLSIGVTDIPMSRDLDMDGNDVAERLMKESLGSGRTGYVAPARLSSDKVLPQDGEWHVLPTSDGEFFVTHVGADGDLNNISSPNLASQQEATEWIRSYENSRQEWVKKFKEEQDIEKLAEMVSAENARRQREAEESEMLSSQRGGNLEFADIVGLTDPDRIDWTADDWNKDAGKLRKEALSSGARSNRYDEIDPDKILLTTDAMRRTDEIGSNTRYIAEYLNNMPSDLKDPSTLRSGDPISFTYGGKKRILYPTSILVKKGGGIRVLGLDDEADDWRSYRIDKIEGLVDGAPYPENPRTPGMPSSERLSSGLTGRMGEAENAVSRIVNFRPARRTVGRTDADVDAVENQLNELIASRAELARRIADQKGISVTKDTRISDIANAVSSDDDDALDALDLLSSQIDEHVSWLEEREAFAESLSEAESEAGERISAIEDVLRSVDKAVDDEDTMDAVESAFEYLETDGNLLPDEKDSISNAISNRDADESRRLVRSALMSERQIADDNFRAAESAVDEFTAPSGRTPRYGDSAYESLSSGRKKRSQGSRRMPWSDEERQLYADRNMLRSKKRPGKKKDGPSADEFLSSGRRYRMPDQLKRRAIGEEMRREVQMKARPLSDNEIREPDGPWILPAKPLLDMMVDSSGRPLPDDEILRTLGITQVELNKMRRDGMGVSEVDAYTFFSRMFHNGGDPSSTSLMVEDLWGFDSAPYWIDRWDRPLDRDGYNDAKEEGILITSLFAPPDFTPTEKEPIKVADSAKEGFRVEDFANALGISDSDEELAKAFSFTADGIDFVPTKVQLKNWRNSGIPTVILERLIESGKIPNAASAFGEAGREFDSQIRQFPLWENLKNALERRGVKFSGPEFSEILGAAKALRRLNNYLRRNEDESIREGKFSTSLGKAPRYSAEEVSEILGNAKNILGVDIPLSEVMPNAPEGESLSSGRSVSRASKRKIKSLDEVEPYDYPKEKYSPTEEQRKVADAIMTGDDVVVRALAGSGKTSTLVATARRLEDQDPNKRIIYIVFQKSNQIDAQRRFAGIKNVEVRTADSIAYVSLPKSLTQKALPEHIEAAKLLTWKRQDAITKNFNVPGVVIQGVEYSPKDSVSLIRKAIDSSFTIGTDREISAKDFIGKHTKIDVDPKDIPAELVEAAQRIWDDITNGDGGVMASKRGYLVKMWSFTEPDLGTGDGMKKNSSGSDIVFFDEAQDQNPVLSEIVRNQGIQKVLVGDSNQAIFGFRGAVDELDKAGAPHELYLTSSFRFGKQVAGVANRFLALMGRKERVDGKGPEGEIVQTVKNPDAILTRSNGGALRAIVQNLKEDKVVAVNKSFKTTLDQFVRTVAWLRDGGEKPNAISEELDGFDTWKQVQEAAEKDDNPRLKMLLKLVEEYGTGELSDILNRVVILPDNEPEFSVEQDGVFREIGGGIKYSFENGIFTIDGGYNIRQRLKTSTPRFRFVTLPPLESGGKERKYWQVSAPASAKGRAELLAKIYEYAGVEVPDVPSEPIDVRVQTAHSAKGMEFGSVQIYDDFPKPKVDKATRRVEMPPPEEMRLAYVAVTRAMKTLGTSGLDWIFDYTTDSDEEYVNINAD